MPNIDDIDRVVAEGPYDDSWESLAQHPVPEWFRDAKFGIFVHWGLFTVPEYRNEWFPRNMHIQGKPEYEYFHEQYAGKTNPAGDVIRGYQDLIPLFTADRFDADEWMATFRRAGARYVMPVAEHHDGYQMYASELSHWNAAETGPHRDILGELEAAAGRDGLTFCASNHRAEHWWFLGHGQQFDSDVRSESANRSSMYWPSISPEPNEFDIASEPSPTEEFLTDWLLRNAEIVEKYHPSLLYFDWWIQHRAFKPYLRKLLAFYYNKAAGWGREVSVCYKYDACAWGSGLVDVERGGFPAATPFPWQTDTAIARNSWCYTDSLEYKTVPELLIALIDAVAKNGNLLLNVGPRADGSIASDDLAVLDGIGRWLAANGDGIYGSRPWRMTGEGPTAMPGGAFSDQTPFGGATWTAGDWRFTSRDGDLFAYCMGPAMADGGELTITTFAAFDGEHEPAFNAPIIAVEQLGAAADGRSASVEWTRDPDGLHVRPLPTGLPDDYPVGFRIRLQ
ncbi:alpha-L-fucosidase [Bifidobacterium choloepi]|uniref:alpha-L-fucosidase n=1 Tax=Bifidobacterium choloepi TaxID=2614131 RepID=A0A6I5N2W7_9BIFI|nr:alpha-L-fucosidase [Bifidobacterium choloepi]NEG70525.1 alpha-L-fucosidase [Bifidobacterium choloepi]